MATPIDTREEIYAEYFEKVTGYIRSHIANPHDREDVASDVFLKIFAKLDRYDENRASLSTWIYTITKNSVIDYYRKREISVPLTEQEAAEESPCFDCDLEALAEALAKLDERERDLIILHYYSGYSLKELAEMMNISYIYIKVLHKKALSELKKLMEGKNYEKRTF